MRALVVYKKSVYDLYSASSDAKVREYTVEDKKEQRRLLTNNCNLMTTLETVVQTLDNAGVENTLLYRADLTDEIVKEHDIAIVVGGDGTVLDVSHYSYGTPILGVNPGSSLGYYCDTNRDGFAAYFQHLAEKKISHLPRFQISIDDAPVKERVLNDVLLTHENPAEMTRYDIAGERYTSSGLLISAPAGSTAFIFNEGGFALPLDKPQLEYTHRSVRNQTFAVADVLDAYSRTRESKIYIDGGHVKYPVGLGSTLKVNPIDTVPIYGNFQKKQKDFIKKFSA